MVSDLFLELPNICKGEKGQINNEHYQFSFVISNYTSCFIKSAASISCEWPRIFRCTVFLWSDSRSPLLSKLMFSSVRLSKQENNLWENWSITFDFYHVSVTTPCLIRSFLQYWFQNNYNVINVYDLTGIWLNMATFFNHMQLYRFLIKMSTKQENNLLEVKKQFHSKHGNICYSSAPISFSNQNVHNAGKIFYWKQKSSSTPKLITFINISIK